MNAQPKPRPEQPQFRLFRLTTPMQSGETHAGEVWIGGRMWTLLARVVDMPDGSRQFHGKAEAPGDSIRRNLEAAQKAAQPDMVDAMRSDDPDDPVPF